MYVHINIHGPRWRVLLDGVDVSAECFAASEERGYVCCYTRDTSGKTFIETTPAGTRRLARHLRRGRVEVFKL